ncbi:MAG: G5 domain-containing protein [Anaerolineaceae bacterium]
MILRRYGLYFSLALVVTGAALFFFGGSRPVLVISDAGSKLVDTPALTAGWAVQEAGYSLSGKDRLFPAASTWLGNTSMVYYFPARPVNVFLSGSAVPIHLETAERIPANILGEIGLKLYPDDRVWSDGEVIDPARPLEKVSDDLSFQFAPGSEVTVIRGEDRSTFHSSEATLGSALFKAGYELDSSDSLSMPADTPLKGPIEVSIEEARPITIKVDGQEIFAKTSAGEVGQALAGAGFALQGQDYSIPDEHSTIPDEGVIKVVRVREEVVLNETEIAYSTETTADPETELDQTSVIQAGRPGLKVTRERVRFENGEEISRVQESEWTAREPVDEKIGYGSKIVVRTMDTPDGPIEYYRAVSVYATSYSPCRQGMGKCSLSTASGIPLKKGIIAVRGSWYRTLGLTQVYVPGYGVGTIADTGGGIPGKYWIDLGYGEEDFINWHETVTIYFLTPVPADVVGILP